MQVQFIQYSEQAKGQQEQNRMENAPDRHGKPVKRISLAKLRGKSAYEIRGFFSRIGREEKQDCELLLDELADTKEERRELAKLAAESILNGAYSFRKEGLKELQGGFRYGDREKCIDCSQIRVSLLSETELEEDISMGVLLGRCRGYARLLGDLPNNFLRTNDFVAYAEELAKQLSKKLTSEPADKPTEQKNEEGNGQGIVSLEIWRNQELAAHNCGGILAVNQAAGQEAAILVLTLQGGEAKAPYTALVGKGILFDSGGYHLKNIDGMEGMKYDMCGAANVLELFEYSALAGRKQNLIAVIPLAENVISQDGVKMGDVITTMSGKTVEVYNTDAEGRLILCDALALACQRAERIIDFATLTYSCKNALGTRFTGVFANDDDYFLQLEKAAAAAGEKIWRMPLDESFHEDIKWSKTADLANYAPGKCAAASTAACFLEEFISEGTPWIHLDMVGTAVQSGDSKEQQEGATGAMISTVARLLISRAYIHD